MFGVLGTNAILNLNNYTLNVSNGNVSFQNTTVTTNVDYDNQNGVRMGNVTASGSVTFQGDNALILGTTGTAKAFSLPLLSAGSGLTGDFSSDNLPRHIRKTVANGIITLTGTVPLP